MTLGLKEKDQKVKEINNLKHEMINLKEKDQNTGVMTDFEVNPNLIDFKKRPDVLSFGKGPVNNSIKSNYFSIKNDKINDIIKDERN